MDIKRLKDSPAGQLVPITGSDPRTGREYEHFAFVPGALPSEPDLTPATWTAVSKAAEALGQLKQACTNLPNPQLLITPALAKEAQATSALEGTYGTLPDVLEARLPGFEPRTPEVREINAYERMAKLGFDWVADRPITFSMLCDLQRILAEASQHRPPEPGQRRTRQVIIGPEDCSVYDARFIPPPGDDRLQAGIDEWERWINEDHDLHVVAQAALAHYQFETLHPFSDCNGRVGRLVIVLQFLRTGALVAPALTISPWLLRQRREYQDHLLGVSQTGDFNPWVQFFCRAVQEQCESHVVVAQQLLDWMAALRRTLHERRWTGCIHDLAEDLINWPVVTNNHIIDEYKVTQPTAQSAIDRLVEVGALVELTGGNYRRIYGATDVMALVESL